MKTFIQKIAYDRKKYKDETFKKIFMHVINWILQTWMSRILKII